MQQTGNKKWMWQLPFLVLLIVGTVLIIRHERNVPYQKSADKVFGTFYHATYQCDSDLTYSINAELAKVDASLSPFNKNSIITAVNQNEDVEVERDRWCLRHHRGSTGKRLGIRIQERH